jgi:hypothetical protein
MQETLNAHLAEHPVPRVGVTRRSLIAASLSCLVIGSGLGYLLHPGAAEFDESEHIRDLEAQYMSLYSAETLVDADSAPSVIQKRINPNSAGCWPAVERTATDATGG